MALRSNNYIVIIIERKQQNDKCNVQKNNVKMGKMVYRYV